MRKAIVGAILLTVSLVGIISVGVWSLSFTEPSNADTPVDADEPSEAQVIVEKSEASTESSKTDVSEQDDGFWEVSVIPPTIEDEKKVTWVFSEVASFFIEEEGGDPAYIVNWIFETVDKYGYELIIDVDPNIYLEQ